MPLESVIENYWEVEIDDGYPIEATESWRRSIRQSYKCAECGTVRLPDSPEQPVQIEERPSQLMTNISGSLKIWHRTVFNAVKPYLPPLVEWPIENAIQMAAVEYVAFHCPMRLRLRDLHPNAAQYQCPACGTWRSRMFGPYNILPDGPLPYSVVFTVLGMMFVNDEVKALPIWGQVKGLKFTRAPRESEERLKGCV